MLLPTARWTPPPTIWYRQGLLCVIRDVRIPRNLSKGRKGLGFEQRASVINLKTFPFPPCAVWFIIMLQRDSDPRLPLCCSPPTSLSPSPTRPSPTSWPQETFGLTDFKGDEGVVADKGRGRAKMPRNGRFREDGGNQRPGSHAEAVLR